MNKTVSTPVKPCLIGDYRYEQTNLLGSGFQSKVFKAQHRTRKHEVALKVVDIKQLGEGINRKLFESQIRCLQALKSTPHVINLHEVIERQDKIYVVTELCFGDLDSRESRKLPRDEAWAYIQQLIKGYRYLYEKGIVHRDLKPGNLFLNGKREVKIGDFGFAAPLNEVRKQNYYNIGSPGYMAPEAIHRNQYSHSSDIWAIGIVYYELLTGGLPWTVKTQEEIQKQMTETYLKSALNRPEIDEDSLAFLNLVLNIGEYDRMKPQDLFQYQLGQQNGSSIDSLNSSNLLTYKSDTLSKTTTDQTSRKRLPCANKPITSFFQDFSPSKPTTAPTSLKSTIPLYSCRNATLRPPSNQIDVFKATSNRRSSFNADRVMSTRNCQPFVWPKPATGEQESFKKKRNSFDVPAVRDRVKQQKIQKSIDLEQHVMAQIKLLQSILEYLKQLELLRDNQRWKSEAVLMKVCLRNVAANILANCNDEAYLKSFGNETDVEMYVNGVCYEKHRIILNNLQKSLVTDSPGGPLQPKSKPQNVMGALNSILSFLAAIEPCLADSKRHLLQIAIAGCEIANRLSALGGNSEMKQEQNIFGSRRVIRKMEAIGRITECMLLKPVF